jgi:hypothetical protein
MILHRARSESNIRPVEGCPRQIVKDALVASFPGAQELENDASKFVGFGCDRICSLLLLATSSAGLVESRHVFLECAPANSRRASTAVQVSNQLGKIGKGGRSSLNVGGLKQSLAFRQALPIRSEI